MYDTRGEVRLCMEQESELYLTYPHGADIFRKIHVAIKSNETLLYSIYCQTLFNLAFNALLGYVIRLYFIHQYVLLLSW